MAGASLHNISEAALRTVITGAHPQAENTFEEPLKVYETYLQFLWFHPFWSMPVCCCENSGSRIYSPLRTSFVHVSSVKCFLLIS